MKNFLLLLLVAFVSLTSCAKESEKNLDVSSDVIQVKQLLDQAAVTYNAPELVIPVKQIAKALHPSSSALSITCNEYYTFSRRIGDNTTYQIDKPTILKILLPNYKNKVPDNPIDLNNDNIFDLEDLSEALTWYNTDFEPIHFESITLTGGGMSGSGDLAFYPIPIIVDQDTIQSLSLFENSNCFQSPPNASWCENHYRISFATAELGTVYYELIN